MAVHCLDGEITPTVESAELNRLKGKLSHNSSNGEYIFPILVKNILQSHFSCAILALSDIQEEYSMRISTNAAQVFYFNYYFFYRKK